MSECPPNIGMNCPHSQAIMLAQANNAVIIDRLEELRSDMKEVRSSIGQIASLEREHSHHKEAMGRVFGKIEELEKIADQHDAALNQFRGMKQLAIGLWTVLAGGLGVVLLKVFSL